MEMIYVVVPVYKVEPYIHRCIDSILNQTYTAFKLILVDDGSPDNCGAICDEYAKQDSRIHVIHQENGGLSAARNAGIEYAMKSGDPEHDWISFIDSDDFVHPRYTEYLYNCAKEYKTDISLCYYFETIHSQVSANHPSFHHECFTPEEFFCNHHTKAILACAKLYRLFLFENIRYPIGKIHEDQFTTHQLLFQCNRIAVVPEHLYYYYQREDSIMHTSWSSKSLDELDALYAQMNYLLQHNFSRSYERSFSVYLSKCLSKSRSMKLAHCPKDEQRKLLYRFRKELLMYREKFGFKKAFQLWFSLRVMRWFKRVFSIAFLKRIVTKLKRILRLS